MELEIINKIGVKNSSVLKETQKKAKSYYGEKLFSKKHNEPRAKIRKITDIEDIEYISLIKNSVNTSKRNITRHELIDMCNKYQLTGGSGNGFPTSEKLMAYRDTEGILLINGVECDPGLVNDAWLYRNKMDDIIKGVDILRKCFSFKRIVLATKEPITHEYNGIKQVKVKDRYPMGYERILIKSIFGIDIPADVIPVKKGILVLNLQTVCDIAEIFSEENWIRSRYVTVSDLEKGKSVVVKAPIGMNVYDVYDKAEALLKGKRNKIYVGGGAFKCHAANDGECIDETTSYIANGMMPKYDEAGKCKGCGNCSSSCPMGIKTGRIVKYIEKNGMNNLENCRIYHPELCIGCGSCTFVCKAGKDVRAIISEVKESI